MDWLLWRRARREATGDGQAVFAHTLERTIYVISLMSRYAKHFYCACLFFGKLRFDNPVREGLAGIGVARVISYHLHDLRNIFYHPI